MKKLKRLEGEEVQEELGESQHAGDYWLCELNRARGMMLPEDLRPLAQQASLGIGLAEKEGINQYYALPNKFLEYMHAGLPQIAMNFPEYQKINHCYTVAVLLDELSVETVANIINQTMANEELRMRLQKNALHAREIYCWQQEEQRLIEFYASLLPA